MKDLIVTSPSFKENDWIPTENSARGKDVSPQLQLDGLLENAESIAITLDDASHPLFPNYNHWIIWNIPVLTQIPAAIPRGEVVPFLGNAVQGIAYGKHCYKGPKPLFKAIHNYTFTIYVLDCTLLLSPKSNRKDFLHEIEGHILQKGTLTGKFQSHRK